MTTNTTPTAEQLNETLTTALAGIKTSGIHPTNLGRIEQWLKANGFQTEDEQGIQIWIEKPGTLTAWAYIGDTSDVVTVDREIEA